MNPGLVDIAVLDQRFTADKHGDSYKADDIEHRIANHGSANSSEAATIDISRADFVTHGGTRKSPTIAGHDCRVATRADIIDDASRRCLQCLHQVCRLCRRLPS